MHVAPASFDWTGGKRRVHPGCVRDQVHCLHCQLRGGDYCQACVCAILDTETLAGFAFAPDLIVAIVKVGACSVEKTFRLSELDLCDRSFAQCGSRGRRYFCLRDFFERIEGVSRGAEHHRYQAADKLQLQWDIRERTALPWRG